MDEASTINQGQAEEQKLNQLKNEIENIKTGTPQAPPPMPQTDQPPMPSPSANEPPSSGKLKTVIWVAVALLILSAFAIGAYYLGLKAKTTPTPTPSPTASPTVAPTSSPMSSWKTYSDTEGGFSFKYPSEIDLRQEVGESVVLSLWGPSQKEDTEFYDGLYLSFKTEDSEGLTLENFVTQRVSEVEVSAEITSVMEATSAGELSGYKFTASALGEFTYYYFELTSNLFLEVVDGTIDPTNAGFEETVQQIFSTLKSACCQ
jgi:hypothetical protein